MGETGPTLQCALSQNEQIHCNRRGIHLPTQQMNVFEAFEVAT